MYTILKSHINSFSLYYVTTFETESQARHFCDWKNSRSICKDDEDTFYNYYMFHGETKTINKPRGRHVKKEVKENA